MKKKLKKWLSNDNYQVFDTVMYGLFIIIITLAILYLH